jgi:hypothetical protein
LNLERTRLNQKRLQFLKDVGQCSGAEHQAIHAAPGPQFLFCWSKVMGMDKDAAIEAALPKRGN